MAVLLMELSLVAVRMGLYPSGMPVNFYEHQKSKNA